MVFSVVMFVAEWNTTSDSWVPRRYERLKAMYSQMKTDKDVDKATNHRISTLSELKNYIDKYQEARIERVLLVNIPGLGVTFDVNDLGDFCGIYYLLLMVLLIFSLVREHENLYLALFKVRRLHEHGRAKSDGESTANYLYHALAMGQVLSSPPTLAQWDPPWIKTRVLNAIFLAPAVIETYVVYQNWQTLGVVRIFGKGDSVMYTQYGFLAVNAILGILAILYSISCDRRWRRAFFYINPELQRVRSRPWYLWLGLSRSSKAQRRMWTQAIERLTVPSKAAPVRSPITVEDTVTVPDSQKIDYRKLAEMCRALESKAARAAGVQAADMSECPREVVSSTLRGNTWRVAARFFGQSPIRNQGKSHLRPEQLDSVRSVVELLTSAWLEGRYDDIERLLHPSAVFVGPGLAGQVERGTVVSGKGYRDVSAAAKVEGFKLGEPGIEVWGKTAVVNCPFTIKYLLEDVLYEESGRDLLVLVNQRDTWLVVWRTMIVDKESEPEPKA
jgi:hypothetical protein